VLAVLAAVLLVRFRIRVTREYDQWRCEVRYGRVSVMDTNRTTIHRRKAVKPKSKTTRRKGLPVSRYIEIAPSVMRAAARALRFLLQHTRVDHFRVSGTVEGSDPAETGVLCGLIGAFVSLVQARTSAAQVAIIPEFMGGGTHLWIDVEASIQTATLVALPFIIFFYLPKKALVQLAIQN